MGIPLPVGPRQNERRAGVECFLCTCARWNSVQRLERARRGRLVVVGGGGGARAGAREGEGGLIQPLLRLYDDSRRPVL